MYMYIYKYIYIYIYNIYIRGIAMEFQMEGQD